MRQTTQLHRDIYHRINERLVQWAKDSFSLCDAAQIEDRIAIMMVVSALLQGAEGICRTENVSQDAKNRIASDFKKDMAGRRK